MLVAIAVMVPLTLASVSGVLVTMRSSAESETTQRLQVALTSATEDLSSLPYVPCADAESLTEALLEWRLLDELLPGDVADADVEVVGVAHRSPSGGFRANCGDDKGAQQLTVRVSDGDESLRGTVVVRDPAARIGAGR